MSPDRTISLRPIGVIRSPYGNAVGTPIQPVCDEDGEGEVIVDPTLEPALADIEGFERIWLVLVCDRADPFRARVVPYRDDRGHGLFATRSPCRPNPIGISVVRLVERRGNVLRVRGLDILDGSPLLGIKPYVPAFDAHPTCRAGWFDAGREDRTVAVGRFGGGGDGSASRMREGESTTLLPDLRAST